MMGKNIPIAIAINRRLARNNPQKIHQGLVRFRRRLLLVFFVFWLLKLKNELVNDQQNVHTYGNWGIHTGVVICEAVVFFVLWNETKITDDAFTGDWRVSIRDGRLFEVWSCSLFCTFGVFFLRCFCLPFFDLT
jgi:hypothetical protein